MTASTGSAVPCVDDSFLRRQGGELRARRAAYHQQVERLSAAVDELADRGDTLDLGDDQGFGEADPMTVERDRVLSLAAQARVRIDDVDSALRRLETGTYGACRSCRRPIPLARLEAVPEASQCVGCASGAAIRRR